MTEILAPPAVLDHYALGTILSVEDLSRGFVNRNSKVVSTRGKYVLRHYSSSTFEEIRAEVRLLRRLEAEQFPVAPPVPRLDGSFINKEEKEYSVLFQFIEGEEPEVNSVTVGVIGRTAAKLNLFFSWGQIGKQFYCTPEYCRNLLTRLRPSENRFSEEFTFLQEELSLLEPTLKKPVPRGLIHGDLFPDNTRFRGNQLQAVLDFDDFGIGPLLTEIGTAVNGFCFIKEEFQEALYQVFLEKYESVRPLEPGEREVLPAYLRWGALVFIAWHLSALLHHPNERQLKRVRLFMRRIRWFRQRFNA